MMNKSLKLFIAGHNGMVGAAVLDLLKQKGYTNIIHKTSSELDLRNQHAVEVFFEREKPDYVIDAAARVGGIFANNNYPYQFLMDNLQMQNNLINASLIHGVEKFIFLGSSCIYPKLAPQPLKEEYLLTSSLEPTNEWYALAKITGVKACEAIRKEYGKNFLSLMPTNSYGPNDNFDLNINNYSRIELEQIFELPPNYDENIIEIKETKLKQNILGDITVPSEIKKNTSINKIILLLDKKKLIQTSTIVLFDKLQMIDVF